MISLDLTSALPEVFLACAAMVLLMLGVFRRAGSTRLVLVLTVVVLAVALLLIVFSPDDRALAFNGLFVTDNFTAYMKVLVLLGAALTIGMSLGYIEREQMDRFEFPVLMLFATLGMLAMVSANDLISLYLGLELQSLSLYVITAFRRDSVRSSEAGLKYFVLGALSSGMLLYGSSMVYGFAGSTNFEALAEVLAADLAFGRAPSLGLIVGLVFLLAGLAFKVSAVPFHMWTPDVYEGAPTPVTAFLASAPKVAAMALIVRVMVGPFGDLFEQWQQIVVVISIGSMVLGAFAAINQTNIKRLMAYSSIGHMGYVLVGLAAGTEAGVLGIVVYLAIYLIMNIGTFACILCMSQEGRMVERIEDLKGLGKSNPLMALALTILMFSMAGIPPLAGFFGKYFVFLAAIKAGLYALAVIGVLASVVGAFYYVRIVKLMYFEEPAEVLDRPIGAVLRLMITGTSLAMVLFLLVAGPVVGGAGAAAAALFAG
ncbi:MAG: NADH-quinone oxidoreductase subunit NuoN [Rhodospirillales bacterium]|nr:NADH-quinone oxidoreductase subunit NuoN [Rhodospirillales bacterium]MDH3791878.1 NADH-quinone oxidoreductase subunit NuoN [Rhodospirillales bacterium]MDH3913763.1 NADH-quinone oxidoreductase subunit NuoN [Rhodospirillales bacterium]MDH3965980.1 NADH-quinone oxidoreductase subunit NuoN [Rhodospirillales bacterium]